jgi:maltodextrin utilization protein YvdJ
MFIKGTGSMVHLYFEGSEDKVAPVGSKEVHVDNDGMMKEMKEVKQEEERKKGVDSVRSWIVQQKYSHVVSVLFLFLVTIFSPFFSCVML